MTGLNIFEFIEDKVGRVGESDRSTIFLNPYSAFHLRHHLRALSSIDRVHLDGMILVAVSQLGGISSKRTSFDYTSIAEHIFDAAASRGIRVALIGSTPAAISAAKLRLTERHPGLSIVFHHHGYIRDEYESVIEALKRSNADLTIIGMGTPLQELFLNDLEQRNIGGTKYTCGGFFHQVAESTVRSDYYPRIINRLNLRAFYRMYREPKLIKRYTVNYPIALLWLLKSLALWKFARGGRR